MNGWQHVKPWRLHVYDSRAFAKAQEPDSPKFGGSALRVQSLGFSISSLGFHVTPFVMIRRSSCPYNDRILNNLCLRSAQKVPKAILGRVVNTTGITMNIQIAVTL